MNDKLISDKLISDKIMSAKIMSACDAKVLISYQVLIDAIMF